jgi:hypothetical protein
MTGPHRLAEGFTNLTKLISKSHYRRQTKVNNNICHYVGLDSQGSFLEAFLKVRIFVRKTGSGAGNLVSLKVFLGPGASFPPY